MPLLCAAAPPVLDVYPPTLDERRLVELVAKVAFNEAHGGTARERWRWLERHSPCVSGRLSQEEAYARPGNCAWTRNLTPTARLPRGWTAAAGVWRRNVSRRWLGHVPRVRRLVLGVDPYRPCTETPHTWDGVRYGREAVATGRRRILDCAVPYTTQPDEEGLHNFAVACSRSPRSCRPRARRGVAVRTGGAAAVRSRRRGARAVSGPDDSRTCWTCFDREVVPTETGLAACPSCVGPLSALAAHETPSEPFGGATTPPNRQNAVHGQLDALAVTFECPSCGNNPDVDCHCNARHA